MRFSFLYVCFTNFVGPFLPIIAEKINIYFYALFSKMLRLFFVEKLGKLGDQKNVAVAPPAKYYCSGRWPIFCL
jgi:hypothetical protein